MVTMLSHPTIFRFVGRFELLDRAAGACASAGGTLPARALTAFQINSPYANFRVVQERAAEAGACAAAGVLQPAVASHHVPITIELDFYLCGRTEPPAPARVLLLASFCVQLHDDGVPHITGLLESAFLSQRTAPSGMWFDAALLTRCENAPACWTVMYWPPQRQHGVRCRAAHQVPSTTSGCVIAHQ